MIKSLICDGVKPSYEDLESELAQTKAELSSTKAELSKIQSLLKHALEEIARLKEQIKCNSKNSSKPPSTDQKEDTSNDQKKKRKKGRKGVARTSFPPEEIDKHIQCAEETCPHCGEKSLKLNGRPSEIIQQAELPEVKAIVTEYELLKYSCTSCGKNSTASLPPGVPDSAFGPKLMGLMATLTGVFHLAKREAVILMKELYGVDIGVGSIPNIEERVTAALDPLYQRIHEHVMEDKLCKHFDETGWRDQGQRHFVWLASCEDAAFYMIDRYRNTQAFQKLMRRETKEFAAVTDRYGVYNLLGDKRQYCLAHLIREFRKYAERDGPDKEIGTALAKELSQVCGIHGKYREGRLSLSQRNRQLGHRKKRVESWLYDGFANGSDELSKLSEKLLDQFSHLWVFAKIHGMEPTNNLAERDLRKLVVWRKKSYGTRSDRGKRFVERMTTVAQTLKKQGKNILGFIQEVVESFYAKVEPPSMINTGI